MEPTRPGSSGRSLDGEAGRSPSSGRNLPVAILSGVVLAAAFLGALFSHPAWFAAVIVVLVAIGAVETARAFAAQGAQVAGGVLVVGALLTVVATYVLGAEGQVLGVVVLFVGAVGASLADGRRRNVVARVGATLLLGLWIGLLGSFGVLLVDRDQGAVVALAVIGGAILTDVGGYVFGSWLGRHRVAPTVSPAKTWEGLVGGLATAVVLAAIVLPLLGDVLDDRVVAAVFALAGGIAGFLGDLVESMVKRDLGLKDMGTVLPGHGGVLDRVDGILLALPVGYYLAEWLR